MSFIKTKCSVTFLEVLATITVCFNQNRLSSLAVKGLQIHEITFMFNYLLGLCVKVNSHVLYKIQ